MFLFFLDDTSQSSEGTEFFNNTPTMIPVSTTPFPTTISTLQTIDERPFHTDTDKQTMQQDTVFTMNLSTIIKTTTMPTETLDPVLTNISTLNVSNEKVATELVASSASSPQAVLITESNSVTNAQPLVMTSSSENFTSTPLSVLLTTRANIPTEKPIIPVIVAAITEQSSSSDEISNETSSTLKTTTFRPCKLAYIYIFSYE